ncbi:MAG: hypothetical protein Q7K55_09070, partial [Candidatus Levybacteria bacterium]|nr:hypothetical protein [Candidatus Levybacteria bacterium]
MKNVLIGSFILGFYLLFANTTLAAGTAAAECQPIYGGGVSCPQVGNIVINKTVKNPKTNDFVNNLDVNDQKFSPDETVRFRITVTNNGDANMSNINVKDIFPEFI